MPDMSLNSCPSVQDKMGMSVFDPRNTILTCEEVKEKLYSGEICLLPTDTGIVVSSVIICSVLARAGKEWYAA